MKQIILTIMLCLLTMTGWAEKNKIIAQTQGSITFVVDENLKPIDGQQTYFMDGKRMANSILHGENIPNDAFHIVATSFADAQNLKHSDKDPFFQCIMQAYANHQSVVLSPDMMWLLISQGFARYVNAHSEELRPLLVSHEGKMDLAIESPKDLLSEDIDWPKLVGDFAAQIDHYTKEDIANTITADFTTTDAVERTALQITLMESVKSYFEYIVYYVACGIPTITLKGTPDDWQRVLDKTRRLKAYGLDEWTASLEPILTEFLRAAEGKPNQKFWQGIVKKKRVDKLKGGGCSPDEPTELDGWLLKFFPDENGQTPDIIPKTKHMPSERVCVGFRYCVIDPAQGTVISETPMQLWAGFIGAEADTLTNTMTPKIGWMVRVSETDDEVLNKMKKDDEVMGINLRVREVPPILKRLQHIHNLHLEFTDAVVLPDWLDKIAIDYFTIKGKMAQAEKDAIMNRFPNIIIKQ